MSLTYIEAPNLPNPTSALFKLFLAGPVIGAPDWQNTVKTSLDASNYDQMLINPRFTGTPPSLEEFNQWIHDMTSQSHAIMYWIDSAIVDPLSYFGLGAWSITDKIVFVGIDPALANMDNIKEQMKILTPGIDIKDNLNDLITQFLTWGNWT
jgi:hypothetical protein